MEKFHNFEEFINESIDSRVRAEIAKHLKEEGLEMGEDYTYSGGFFMVKDIETAETIADACAGVFRCTINDDRKTPDGRIPMMIVK